MGLSTLVFYCKHKKLNLKKRIGGPHYPRSDFSADILWECPMVPWIFLSFFYVYMAFHIKLRTFFINGLCKFL